MSDLEIIVFAIASVVIILISLYVVISMTKDINITIRECEKIGVWAKKSWKGEPMGAYDCDCINNLEYEKREQKAQLFSECTTSDMISRTETVERLYGVLDVTVPITDYDDGYVDGVEVGISTVSTMPTIQPERKKGEWIEISSINHTYKCSECGRLLVNITDGRNSVSKHYPYCHCGAKMKGE